MLKKYSKYINENINNDYTDIIEFSILKKDLKLDNLNDLIDQALNKNFKIISTLPEYVNDIKTLIDKKPIKISTMVDFPEGKSKFKDNLKKINELIILGVDEIDVTINSGVFNKLESEKTIEKLKDLEEDLKEFSYICHREGKIFKIVIDLNFLTFEAIKKLVEILNNVGADYIQTSTGQKTNFNKANYLSKILPERIGIKIAGGIRTNQDIKEYISLSNRIATSTINL